MESAAQALQSFEKRHKRPPIPLREKWIVASLAVFIFILPWMLGGMRWWPQLIFLALSIIPFILLFVPMRIGNSTPLENLKKLIKFPIFWLGLLFIIYVFLGAINPSWQYTVNLEKGTWRIVQIPPDEVIQWLPTSVSAAPYSNMNAWRMLVIFCTAFFFVGSFWAGVKSRRCMLFLLGVVSFTAFLVAMMTIIQYMSGTKEVYGLFESANVYFRGPFIYRNHGAAYMCLGLGASVGGFLYYWGRRTGHKSTPAFMFLFMAVCIGAGLLYNMSRGGLFFGACLMLAGLILILFKTVLRMTLRRNLAIFGFVTIFLVALFFVVPRFLKAYPELDRMSRSVVTIITTPSILKNDTRVLATKATWSLFLAQPVTGWGAGSFRYVFAPYQKEFINLFYQPHSLTKRWFENKKRGALRRYFSYAHNDWVQLFAEYGVVGTSAVILGLYYCYGAFLYRLKSIRFYGVMIFVTTLVFLFHCIVDFVGSNPPVMLVFMFLLLWPLKMQEE